METKIDITEFLRLANQGLIIDVRSESEFNSGHIPSAVNIPILSDNERKTVGTLYKKHGKSSAILKGLELSGPQLSSRLKQGIKLINERQPLIHCWRGGMRSEFYSILFKFYGVDPLVLNGGYKCYRQFVHSFFEKPFQFIVLGGKTGCGKTAILYELRKLGEQVIDLEDLANHKGSAFGGLGKEKQPTQEQFENNLFFELHKFDLSRPIWIENENRLIGDKVIPTPVWDLMLAAPLYIIEKTFDERLALTIQEYGHFNAKILSTSFQKISKRIGPLNTKIALELLQENNIGEAFRIALSYYDRSYDFNASKKERIVNENIDAKELSNKEIALQLYQLIN
jgi:tRNA 2-selenouridine synthase